MNTVVVNAARLDVTDDICPITWVKTKLALEALETGEVLEVLVNDGEPLRNIPGSAKEEGHKVTSVRAVGDGTYILHIRRGGRG
jgi:tRNA 2-thiouridine synthesizing protein A